MNLQAQPIPRKMWSYDLAREQKPNLDFLRKLCSLTRDSGYDAICLYFEHNFPFPSLTPLAGSAQLASYNKSFGFQASDISTLESEFPEITILPMMNVLGHMEGFLRTENSNFPFAEMSEEKFKGLQACPLHPDTQRLARTLIDDIVGNFRSPIIHIGGDETAALGTCDRCRAKVEESESQGSEDGKADLYAEFYLPLIQAVIDHGRRPAIWGDMVLEHPSILKHLPKETLIFDWQYFDSPEESSAKIKSAGFEVVGCPSLLAYNSAWLQLKASEENVKSHADALKTGLVNGVCVTTWEPGLFGGFETWLPAIAGCGKILSGDAIELTAAYAVDQAEQWAILMGIELPQTGPSFAFGKIRSGIKCRFLLYSNPFLLWLRHPDLACEPGNRAADVLQKAIEVAPNSAYRGISEVFLFAIEFTRRVQKASQLYNEMRTGECITELAITRQYFDHLEKVAIGFHARSGGSLADIHRCRAAKLHVEKVMRRIQDYSDGNLGYRPSFEHLTHPLFVPYDQGAWWLVNKWAQE